MTTYEQGYADGYEAGAQAAKANMVTERPSTVATESADCVTIPMQMFVDLMNGKYRPYALSMRFRAIIDAANKERS